VTAHHWPGARRPDSTNNNTMVASATIIQTRTLDDF
jgi:hypothetical protein